ncbi:SusC/RagA family TonB-linked outer membrane protein [Niabella sp.]|uniref:SusC/RagA family TonB-linked outer membrane protein n=1 Tax=Niabella sp. TaxID=1962976 RepID=UPI00261DFF12|nr:SusC/RagA family TonB-linked outer membrane protein [Niabella sp.]
MRKLVLLLALVTCSMLVFAQTRTITGTVKDEAGNAIPFATISEKGTSNAASSDEAGNFSLRVNENAILVFSSTGYKAKELPAAGRTRIDLTLQRSETETIQEVIVTAYGTQKKEEIAGSISTLKAEEIGKSQSSNVLQSLAGKVGGVQIRSTSGQPGVNPSVRFRGIGSISSSNQPLYVVDGVPYNGDVAAISPQDIDQISFLKDASANALYGSRGANGVIIITTKKGKGQMDITYDGRIGVNSRAIKDYDIIKDPKEYYELRWQRLRLGAKTASNSWDDAGLIASKGLVKDLGYNIFNVANDQIIDPKTGKINSGAQVKYHDDWDDALFGNSVRHEHFVSLRYGTDKLSSYLSGGYLKDEGYVVNSGFDRVSARANLDYKPYSFLKVGGNVNFAATKMKDPQAGKGSSTYSNLFSWTRNMAPIYPIYARDKDGNFIMDKNGDRLYDWGNGETTNPDNSVAKRTYITNMNPYATTVLNTQYNENKNLSLRGYASVDFLKNFNFTYNLGYDYLGSYRVRLATDQGGDAAPYGGSITNAAMFDGTITNQQLLTYEKKFDDHSLNVMVGHESSKYTSKMLAGTKTTIVIPGGPWVSNASKYSALNGFNDNYDVEGYLSKLNYNYAGKYYLNASYRRDGSSVFHPDNRWGNFYGVGAAWIASKENFLAGSSIISNLKIKASYGEQGNDNLFYPSYVNMDHRSHFGFGRNFMPYVTQYEVTSDAGGNPVIKEVYFGNKDLRWEVSKNLNAGFELGMWRRLNLEVEFFRRAVSDMLYNFPLAPSSGTPSVSRNIGDMRNTGVEINLDGDVIQKEDLDLNLWVNATHYKNRITRLPDPFVSGVFRFVEGKSAYTYYLREFAGVDPETGEGKWYTGDVDGKTGVAIGPKTETKTHSTATQYLSDKTANPDLYGGFGLNLNYKKLSVALGFAYQMGGYIYDNVYQGLFGEGIGMGSSGANYSRDVYNTWTPENKTATLPILSSVDRTQYASSDLFLIKASYISLENVSVSYSLGGDFINRLGLRDVRVNLLGNNLWMKSKRQGLDPRMMQIGGNTNNGLTLNSYSLLRTLSLGLTVKF